MNSKLWLAVLIALGGLACGSAFAEEVGNGSEAVPASAQLRQYLLSDQDIESKCQTAIAAKYDLVEVKDAEGSVRKITRCEKTYQTLRSTAQEYLAKEDQGKQVIQDTVATCQDEASCDQAAKTIQDTALDTHQGLSETAERGNSALNELLSANGNP